MVGMTNARDVLVHVANQELVDQTVIGELYGVILAANGEEVREQLASNPRVFAIVVDAAALDGLIAASGDELSPTALFESYRHIGRPDLHVVGVARDRQGAHSLKERGCDKSCLDVEVLATLRAIQRRRTTGRLKPRG